jgi:hypothetical protein
MLKNLKIGRRLMLIGFLTIALPLIAVTFIAVTRACAGLEDLNDQLLLRKATEIAHNIDTVYTEEMKLSMSLAANPVIVTAAVTHEQKDSRAADAQSAANDHLAPFRHTTEIGGAYEALSLAGTDDRSRLREDWRHR